LELELEELRTDELEAFVPEVARVDLVAEGE
jgi:hypothetical protein